MSITNNVIVKVVGPILIGKFTSPITAYLEPPNALTIKMLGFILTHSKDNITKVVLGITFKEEPVSTKTLDSNVYTHLK